MENIAYHNHSRLIRLLGSLLFVGGVASAAIAPLETHTFNSFSVGGRFHYEGFGFGTLMFGIIAVQVLGYYLVALLAIPLGYGLFRLRRWAYHGTLTLLYDWLVLGLPLSIVLFLMLVTSKELPPSILPLLAAGIVLIYPVLPILLVRFFRSKAVHQTLASGELRCGWFEQVPQRILVVGSLLILFALALHIPMLFNGLFPLFTGFLSGRQGVLALDLAVLLLALLAWGVLERKPWAWWGTLVMLAFLLVSSVAAFSTASLSEVLAPMNFAPLEREILKNVPIRGYVLAILSGGPLLATWILLLASKAEFRLGRE